MDNKKTNQDLDLRDLVIENFRGIKKLRIPRLGRVTLIAGKNGAGKTTVLEAIRVYAARGRHDVLEQVLTDREEFLVGVDEEGGNEVEPDWLALFYGRDISQDVSVAIGPTLERDRLVVRTIPLTDLSDRQLALLGRLFHESLDEVDARTIRAVFQERDWTIPQLLYPPNRGISPRGIRARLADRGVRFGPAETELPTVVTCESLGPDVLNNIRMAQYWDRVALTDSAVRAVDALGLIFGNVVDGVAMVGEDTRRRLAGRRAIVKLKGSERPVPMHSLGDGALRIFCVALALANSKDGFLVIDEAENGIHHTVQRDFWSMVLQAAQVNNVQVIATTHSWDCVKGFAQAANENDIAEGVLVRLERNDGMVGVVQYSEDELQIAAEQDIEVR